MRLLKNFFVFLTLLFVFPYLASAGIIKQKEHEKKKEILQKIEEKEEKEEEETKEEMVNISSRPPLPTSKIEETYGLTQFGYQIFSGPSTFFPITKAPVGPGYVLGPGDEVIIDLWGMIEAHYKSEIDRDGGIVLPKVGRIQLWGQTFENVQTSIKKQFLKHYKGFQINTTMGKLRTIQVFLAGEVVQPGTYQLSSLSTIFTALYAAGGPTKMGSLRNIKLIRNNKVITSFDLYPFLLFGDKSNDLHLQCGDVVFISPIGRIVGISGDVKRPAIYELKEKDITLKNLVQLAAGFLYSNKNYRLHLEKMEARKRKIIETKLTDSLLSERLKGGDFAQVFAETVSLYKEIQYVTLKGEINFPGRYAIIDKGEKLSSVLKRAGGYTEEAYLPAAVFIREAVKQKQERILARFLDNQRAALLAKSSQVDTKLDIANAERLADLISQTIPLGRIAITLLPLPDFKDSSSDIILCDSDQLTVLKKPSGIPVIGSINSPGVICYKPGLTQDYYTDKCGGLTRWANKDGIFIIKANGTAIQNSKLTRFMDPGDTIVVPQRFRESLWTMFKDTVQILYQIGISAAALSSIN